MYTNAYQYVQLNHFAVDCKSIIFQSLKCMGKKAFKNHLPEERGILYHFLNGPVFLDTHLHSQGGVHSSEKGSDTCHRKPDPLKH